MTTFKKKDLKNYKVKNSDSTEKSEIEELVDDDGVIIGGGKGSDMTINNDSEIFVPDQQTGDEFAAQALQPNRYYYGIDGTPYSHGDHGNFYENEEKLAEAKMRDMVERITNNRSQDKEFVNKSYSSDVNRNNTPDYNEIDNSVVINATDDLIDALGMLDDEGVASVVNHIVMSVSSKIPQDYKTVIKKNL